MKLEPGRGVAEREASQSNPFHGVVAKFDVLLRRAVRTSNREKRMFWTGVFLSRKFMAKNSSNKFSLVGTLGLVWCFVVLFSYYFYNDQYYIEKISTFGRFFLRSVGI